jgi:hypothetical protein
MALNRRDIDRMLALANRLNGRERDTRGIDPMRARLDEAALAYQKSHPGTDYATALNAVRGQVATFSANPLPAHVYDELEREGLDARIRKVAQREGISYAHAFERVCDGDPGPRPAPGWRRA